MERPALVSHSPGDVEGLSLISIASRVLNAEGNAARDEGVQPPASRLACLRERFSLSAEASSLMLSLWRTKSPQIYDSLFRKWASWCSEWSRDPISGPIANVANFLAHLHKEGYQSRSLNSFRSAIPSVHDPVDGVEVGKHPTITRLLKGAFHASLSRDTLLLGMCK